MTIRLVEAQRKLAILATGYRPPFDPDKILDERFQAIRDEVICRKPKLGLHFQPDGTLVCNGTVRFIGDFDPTATAYLTIEPPEAVLNLPIWGRL